MKYLFSKYGFTDVKLNDSLSFPKLLKVGTATYKGSKVFIKYWNGLRKNSSLQNEINVYKMLNSLEADSHIKVPKIVFSTTNENKILIAFEYIAGKQSHKLAVKKKIEILKEVLDYLHGLKLSDEILKKHHIKKRSQFFYLISMFYILLRSLLNYSRKSFEIIKSMYLFLKFFPSLYKSRMLFTHRDLNFDNILISQKAVYLIDFQYSVITCEEFEYAATARSLIKDPQIIDRFVQFVRFNYLKNNTSFSAFRAMCIYYAMLGLIDKNFTAQRTQDFFRLLKYVDNLKQ